MAVDAIFCIIKLSRWPANSGLGRNGYISLSSVSRKPLLVYLPFYLGFFFYVCWKLGAIWCLDLHGGVNQKLWLPLATWGGGTCCSGSLGCSAPFRKMPGLGEATRVTIALTVYAKTVYHWKRGYMSGFNKGDVLGFIISRTLEGIWI